MENTKVTQELAKQNITEQVIAKLKENLTLKINGIEDVKGYELVKRARIECKNTRVLAQKICKKGREPAIAEQKAWIEKENEIVSEIQKIENYLSSQEQVIDVEKERVKIDAIRTKQLPERKQWLEAIGVGLSDEDIKKFDDVQFMKFIQDERDKILNEKEIELNKKEEVINAKEIELKKPTKVVPAAEDSDLRPLGDKEKIKLFIIRLSSIIYPEVEDPKMKEYVEVLRTSITRVSDFITKKLN